MEVVMTYVLLVDSKRKGDVSFCPYVLLDGTFSFLYPKTDSQLYENCLL